MAALISCLPGPASTTHPASLKKSLKTKTFFTTCSPPFSNRGIVKVRNSYRMSSRGITHDDEEICSFDEAVSLFNTRDYYKCHDVLEALWNNSQDPTRTLLHGILQCAVGFHHLFNHNHKGAMMELGEGLCKLRKMNFQNGPFHQFERDISAVLEFIYQTQLEQAACTEQVCVAMDQSERSYQLLGGYAAGERLYHLEIDRSWNAYIVFLPEKYRQTAAAPPSIKIPLLEASEQHVMELDLPY
ncbi:uncharacterized protein LOC131004149 isoform X2 [Salvia miltiorrhiza]|uniref:uncharacterized protein LOC131002859 isoform X3 n=1 Tax=Salvia miltiorrhiza TaxID=226208 RepID=UPI0025AD1230|nr:uncharacterized protein LOC131002859 isoform X3 [Salvia miltiorrhiza]XP_057786762.1 uncharacterized protein LOC131004149 isoform X2 [Salvia miltiorrhiza]